MQSGEFSNCSFTKIDFFNNRRDDRENMINHDVDILIQKFEKLKAEDSNYYYSYVLDDQGAMKQLFLADSRSINDHRNYGDAITFDTTYNTNKYKLIIGIFCGVNNHLRTVLFASGFLANESTDSFIWLFSELKKCMESYPKTIITYQDAAMKGQYLANFPTHFIDCANGTSHTKCAIKSQRSIGIRKKCRFSIKYSTHLIQSRILKGIGPNG